MKVKFSLLLFIFIISGCENHSSNFEAQMKVCVKGEEVGILNTAVEACQNAVNIAEWHKLSPVLLSQALYRLGSLKRKQGEFAQAENILRKIIIFEINQITPNNQLIASSLLELSLSLAGQDKWNEGSSVLRQLNPLTKLLSEQEKSVLKNAFKQFAIKLRKRQNSELEKKIN